MRGRGIVIEFLENKNINFKQLSNDDVLKFKKKWVSLFVPENKVELALNSYTLDRGGYLWHVFSYEILDAFLGLSAKNNFDSVNKTDGYYLSSAISDELYYISDLSNIDSDLLDLESDVVLTSSDFSWTYAKTHEIELGPYFYLNKK